MQAFLSGKSLQNMNASKQLLHQQINRNTTTIVVRIWDDTQQCCNNILSSKENTGDPEHNRATAPDGNFPSGNQSTDSPIYLNRKSLYYHHKLNGKRLPVLS